MPPRFAFGGRRSGFGVWRSALGVRGSAFGVRRLAWRSRRCDVSPLRLASLHATLSTLMAARKHDYDESKIKTLSPLEHIRLRTGMYIGRLGDGAHYDDGIYVLLKEVVDNAFDEYIMGYGKEIDVAIEKETVRVR